MEYIAAYQEMIASGKIYAASAYLKALAGKYDAFEQHYRQLAYAMNDPMEHCTYNSDTIFQIFYGESEPVSDYYVVAAALRNYFWISTAMIILHSSYMTCSRKALF